MSKRRLVTPPLIIKDGHVHFTTMRQELLAKPEPQTSRNHSKRDPAPVVISECTWEEPFVLYYCEACLQWDDSKSAMNCDESPLKFAIQMGYDELVTRKRGVSLTEHLVGEQESFHLDQFSEGEIYLKEIRFGSKQSKNDILGFE